MKFNRNALWLKPEILLMAVFSIVFHLVFINNLEYHRDELLYFSLGMHPAAGYASVPPFIGWIACIMQNIFGYSLFAVRLFPAILSGALILLTAALAGELGGSRYSAFLAALGLNASIFFMRTFSLFQPVHIDVFMWTLSIWLVMKFINTGKDKFLLLLGVAAGISLLNKYLAAMLFIGFAVIIPFTEYRKVFINKKFWAGIGIGALIFLPNLFWQMKMSFPVFRHMNELYGTQLVYMDYGLFLKEQLLMPGAATILSVAGLIFLIFSRASGRFRFLGFLAIFVIAGLMLLKGKSYYTLGVYPLLITAGAVSYELLFRKIWLRMLLPVTLVTIALPVVPIGIQIYGTQGLVEYFSMLEKKYGLDIGRRFEDGTIHSLPQDYADMLGWEEMASLAAKAYGMIEDKSSAFIYCENYGQAGAVTVIGKKYGLPQAVCFNESFLYWLPMKFEPDIKSFVYINDEPGDDVRAVFREITEVGAVSNPDAREYGTKVFLCRDPVESFNGLWISKLREMDLYH